MESQEATTLTIQLPLVATRDLNYHWDGFCTGDEKKDEEETTK